MSKKTNNKIDTVVEKKVLEFGELLKKSGISVDRLVVFGSYAKNQERENSDIDVCVVSPDFGNDQMEEMQYLFKARREIDGRIEPYPASLAEYADIRSPLMSEIRKYGLELMVQ